MGNGMANRRRTKSCDELFLVGFYKFQSSRFKLRIVFGHSIILLLLCFSSPPAEKEAPPSSPQKRCKHGVNALGYPCIARAVGMHLVRHQVGVAKEAS